MQPISPVTIFIAKTPEQVNKYRRLILCFQVYIYSVMKLTILLGRAILFACIVNALSDLSLTECVGEVI